MRRAQTPGRSMTTETELSCIIRPPLPCELSVLLAASVPSPFLSVRTIFNLGTLIFFLETRRVEDGCPRVSTDVCLSGDLRKSCHLYSADPWFESRSGCRLTLAEVLHGFSRFI
jgi:hypothetical protein